MLGEHPACAGLRVGQAVHRLRDEQAHRLQRAPVHHRSAGQNTLQSYLKRGEDDTNLGIFV